MIDFANPPKYVKQTTTGRIYVYAPNLAERDDMEPYEGEVAPVVEEQTPAPAADTPEAPATEAPVDDEKAKLQEENAALLAKLAALEAPVNQAAPDAPDAAADMSDEDRIAKIKEAVASIPVENYGQPFGGKPAMPKVGDVSAAAGFKVFADEIQAVMGLPV